MGKFEKGNKLGKGRIKGSKNRATLLGKEILESYFFDNDGEGLRNHLREIDAMEYEKDRVSARQKVLELVIPKQKEIEITGIEKDELTDEELAERLKQYEQRNK